MVGYGQKFLNGKFRVIQWQQLIRHERQHARAGPIKNEKIERNNFLHFQIIYDKIGTTESKIAAARILCGR